MGGALYYVKRYTGAGKNLRRYNRAGNGSRPNGKIWLNFHAGLFLGKPLWIWAGSAATGFPACWALHTDGPGGTADFWRIFAVAA